MQSSVIFGNAISVKTQKKARATHKKYQRKFGDDSGQQYQLSVEDNPVLTPALGVQNLAMGDSGQPIDRDKGVIVGNIRMGYGHYRIAMAIASAARHLGYQPYWFDMSSYGETTGSKVITHLNELYSLGSRLSQKSRLFNKYYWEPLNSEGFRKLDYNAVDLEVAKLMMPIFNALPKDMPFIGTHTWTAQAAVHARMNRVVNIIPDNWPMALHLAEGSIHTVQTPSSYLGYKALNGMNGSKPLKPMPDGSVVDTGHYIDHELLHSLADDCQKRLDRLTNSAPKRLLFTIGGAGAQYEIYRDILKKYQAQILNGELTIFVNAGDHKKVVSRLLEDLPALKAAMYCCENDWPAAQAIAEQALNGEVKPGVHLFYNEDIFSAVYLTNLLMRASDVLITKPSELAFYPVPKLMIKRVGGHEAYGALRAAEIGDGTYECESTAQILAMLDLMLTDPTVLGNMNEAIVKAQQAGIYDGAYQAVRLAVGSDD